MALEYKIVRSASEYMLKEVNKLAAQGWELSPGERPFGCEVVMQRKLKAKSAPKRGKVAPTRMVPPRQRQPVGQCTCANGCKSSLCDKL